jgi:hypothetical protein
MTLLLVAVLAFVIAPSVATLLVVRRDGYGRQRCSRGNSFDF